MTVWTVPAVVCHVHDGDTMTLNLDLGWHISYTARVRIAGINAPELPTVEGQAAAVYAAMLLPVGSAVTFTSRSLDKYGRPLGSVLMIDGRDFGQVMLAAGHAVTYGAG